MMAKTIAIMQPYFMPYLGYFRLFSQSDLFVIYDCVQFPRRGVVHRNQVPAANGNPAWLTLPLAKCDQKTPISNLRWRSQDIAGFANQLGELKNRWEIHASSKIQEEWLSVLTNFDGSVVDYLERTLQWVCQCLEIPFNTIRSSSLDLDPTLKGQDRILEICRRQGATRYLNSPGGRELYQEEDFLHAGLDLSFLPEFSGNKWSMAYRLLSEDSVALKYAFATA